MNVMAMNILERARPDLDSICRKFGVRTLSVFGSALSDRWKAESSDFDFVVEYGPPTEGIDLFAQQFVMQVELDKLLGCSVDLIEPSAIRKPTFREVVEQDASEIYAEKVP